MPQRAASRGGSSLLELLLALAVAALLSGSALHAFEMLASARRFQLRLVSVQQDGRLALARLSEDLRQAYAHGCPPRADSRPPDSAPLVYGGTWPSSWPDLPASADGSRVSPGQAYPLPAVLQLKGYDCDLVHCRPEDPVRAGLPPMGTRPGQRVPGTAVLSLRYLDRTAGWRIDGEHSRLQRVAGWLQGFHLEPAAGEPALSAGPWWWLESCGDGRLFTARPTDEDGDYVLAAGQSVPAPHSAGQRVFDLRRAWHTVSYYLKVVDTGGGATTGALVRRLDGEETAGELVRGIERLDFVYQVADAKDRRYDLDAAALAAAACPPGSAAGVCSERYVQRIRVDLLADGETPLRRLRQAELDYLYPPDGWQQGPPSLAARRVHPDEQGFAPAMLRRPFYTVIAVREFHP